VAVDQEQTQVVTLAVIPFFLQLHQLEVVEDLFIVLVFQVSLVDQVEVVEELFLEELVIHLL
jgi:hypothetical protein